MDGADPGPVKGTEGGSMMSLMSRMQMGGSSWCIRMVMVTLQREDRGTGAAGTARGRTGHWDPPANFPDPEDMPSIAMNPAGNVLRRIPATGQHATMT